MSVFAFGLNHTTAPVPIRERVVFPPEDLEPALKALSSCDGINEAAIVSTCNRTDLYCEGDPGSESLAIEWFRSYHALAPEELLPYLYRHREDEAIRHLLRVASGLDSLVLGEPQILGQVKQAHATARSSGTLGGVLDRLFQQSFSVAKQVRTETAVGSSPISVAYAAVSTLIVTVGAVLIVGGNINHVTRTMTTAIALETSKGELALALGLGMVLVTLSVIVSAAVMGLRASASRLAYA